MALGDFRKIFEKTEVIKQATIEEVKKAFEKLPNANIQYSLPGKRKARRSDGFEHLTKTVDLSKYTVVEFTAERNADDAGITNNRYNMKQVKAFINSQNNIEAYEKSILEFLDANALMIKNKPVKSGEIDMYPLNVGNKVLYSTAPWYLRGHGIAAAMRSTNTEIQEAGQAVGLFTAYMMDSKGDEIDIRHLNSFENRFHFSLYNNKRRVMNLLEWYIYNFHGAVEKCVDGGAKVFAGLRNPLTMHLSDMSCEAGHKIAESGIGPNIRSVFNELNKKQERKFKNINSWCPADIVVYDESLKREMKPSNFADIDEYTKWLNRQTETNRLRLISLKLNTSRWDNVISRTSISDKKRMPEILDKKWEVNQGNIYLYVHLNEDGIKITDKNQGNVIRLKFTVFDNDKGASIEADYLNTKQVHFNFEREILVENFNRKENTQTMLGKARDTLNYYLAKKKIDTIDDVNFVWPEQFKELLHTDAVDAFNARTTTKPSLKRNTEKLVLRDEIMKLYSDWLNKMRKFCLYRGEQEVNKSIDEFILYTIYAGKKENFQDMDFFPKYYKIG